MQNPDFNRNTKVLGLVASRFGLPLLLLALIGSSCSTAKKSDSGTASSSASPVGNGRGTGGRGGFGAGGGTQTGGFFVYAGLANPATGAVTVAPAPTTPDPSTAGSTAAPTKTGINESGFRVQCTTDTGSAVQKIALALKVVTSAGVEYDSDLNFKSNCSDFARITVADLAVGDVATLSVNLSTLDGVAYASGTTASYTQAAAPTPAPAANDSGSGGRPNFTAPTATEVPIALQPVTASSSGTTVASGSGT